jgi:ornithine cyclodeaminase/alanine dehydrogenase-like protein (mu-crystallin family)
MRSTDHLLYLDESTVRSICSELDPLELIREVFRLHGTGKTVLPDEAYLGWKTPRGETVCSLNMPAYVGGTMRAAGTKIINSNPANTTRGLPRASGLTLLFDQDTVQVKCMMEGASISALRTAAVSMLCVVELSKCVPRCITVIGTGPIGKAHVELAARRFASLERIILFDRNVSAAKSLANFIKTEINEGVAVEIADSAKSAVQASEVVIAATTVTAGYIHFDWLLPGALAINVSLDDLLPEVFLKADRIFVDDWKLIKSDSRRCLGKMYREGQIVGPRDPGAEDGLRRIDGEIADVVLSTHPGRRSSEEIIVVNPFGLAIEDVAFASRIFELAKDRGAGVLLSR